MGLSPVLRLYNQPTTLAFDIQQTNHFQSVKNLQYLLNFVYKTFFLGEQETNMISPKKLIKMAKKWQKLAANKRRRISFPGTTGVAVDAESCSTSPVAEKGHCFVYTADEKRFVIPLAYLKNIIITELFKMAEDEFGLPSSGPITLPCDEVFMEYVVSLIHRHAAKDVEKALLMSLITGRCLSSSFIHQERSNHQSFICSY